MVQFILCHAGIFPHSEGGEQRGYLKLLSPYLFIRVVNLIELVSLLLECLTLGFGFHIYAGVLKT